MAAQNLLKVPNFIEPYSLIAGLDEVGRGCLAGPVVAAAVILNPARPIAGLADSKSLSSSKREKLSINIKNNALAWGLGISWQKRIDEINILQASFEAMAKAVAVLKIRPEHLLVDGPFCIPVGILAEKACASLSQTAIIRGDQSEACISAASIIAKCFRDQLMKVFSRKWPNYCFAQHKGYATKVHLQALAKYGPCPLHRLSFKKVLPDRQAKLPL